MNICDTCSKKKHPYTLCNQNGATLDMTIDKRNPPVIACPQHKKEDIKVGE